MEVSELVARIENCSWIDTSLEPPSNQQDPNTSAFILLGKIITYKNIGIATVTDVVNRSWRLAFQIQVSRLDKITFMFHFNREADMTNAYRRRPWSVKGGHLVLKQ